MAKLTLTGIDETVSPEWMWDMVHTYSNYGNDVGDLEFGILRSPKRQGVDPRYPSPDVIRRIANSLPEASLAFHLCGQYSAMVLANEWAKLSEEIDFSMVSRVQVNSENDSDFAIVQLQRFACYIGVPVVMQWRASNYLPYIAGLDVLQDRSGGAGKEESTWFQPSDLAIKGKMRIGYAGGLNPDNIEAKLPEIKEAARGMPFWVDCESGIRTDNLFDRTKAKAMVDAVLGNKD